MDWGTVVAVLVAMAIFMGALIVVFGTGGVLMMPAMFKKTSDTHKCPVPGCPFPKVMEDALHGAGRKAPMAEAPHEAEREKVAV